MSYYVLIDDFRVWLNRAQRALVSKNKVRKDLWTDFCEILLFEHPENTNVVRISQSNYTSISTFLQTEGRSDTLKDDSILNWVTTLHELRKLLNEEIQYVAKTRESSPTLSGLAHDDRKYPSSASAPQISTESATSTSSGDQIGRVLMTRSQTHPLSTDTHSTTGT